MTKAQFKQQLATNNARYNASLQKRLDIEAIALQVIGFSVVALMLAYPLLVIAVSN